MDTLKLPPLAANLIKTFQKNGFVCYAVGGCIRDLMLDIAVTDWDFTTNATPTQIQSLFSTNSYYNNTYGTVSVKIKNTLDEEVIIEVTTFRSEKDYKDFRRPSEVAWGKTIEEDLMRRDFTINAMAFDGKTLVDPFGGKKDLSNKLIRAVGDPNKRFEEDALRLMRAIRIAAQLNFVIEEKTSDAIKQSAVHIKHISSERIRDELIKLLKSNHPAEGILLLKEHNLLYLIFPELEPAFTTEQKSPERHHIYDVGTHSVESLKNCPSTDPIIRLATLLHDIGKPKTKQVTQEGVITFFNHELVGTQMVYEIAKRLRFSNRDVERLTQLVRWHQFSVDEKQTDSAIRRFIRNVGKEHILDMLALRTGDRLGGGARETSWRLELYKKRIEEVQKQPFSITDLAINGHDVMKILNLEPGPKIGEILAQLFEKVVQGELKNNRNLLIEALKNIGSTN